MKILPFFLPLLLLAIGLGAGESAEPTALFPVYEKGYFGFVDQKGRMQIKPRFRRVGIFYNGLAPVQENAGFGYIDMQGQYVIEPQFDDAFPFGEIYAEVISSGRKYLIDRQGQIQFEHNYRDWEWADGERRELIVTTQSGQKGLIDLTGTIILDTIYREIRPFSEGLSTVTRSVLLEEGEEMREMGVFNRSGDLIVPFGRFDQIDPFRNGYARVIRKPKKEGQQREARGVINHEGEIQFLLKDKLIDFIDFEQMYQEGLAEIAIHTVDQDTLSVDNNDEIYTYRGVIDPDGKIVFSHPQVKDLTPFQGGRAFAKTASHNWVLIDRKGKRIGQDYYRSVPAEGFENGVAVVGMEEGLALIGTEGQLLLPLADLKTTYYQRVADVVLYEVEILEKDTYIRRWGFWDLHTGQIFPPRYHKVDREAGFQKGLLQVEEDGRQGYVSRDGKYVWRAARL